MVSVAKFFHTGLFSMAIRDLRFTIYHLPFTIYHSPFTIHHLPFTIHHSPFTIHHLPFTIYHLPFTIYHSRLMSELSELYQQVILDHNKKPRNFRKLETANHSAEGYNPLCGDQLTVYIDLEENAVKDISFEGSGCAISKAAASMMTQAVKGKTKQETEHLFDEFHRMVTGELDEENTPNQLGNLRIFAGVREFPVRVKCATLSWHTMLAALSNQELVSTE
jgi:nitrogen fixation NifU-like protein